MISIVEILTDQHLIKKNMLLLSIPEPCHEKWNEMLPVEKGAGDIAVADTALLVKPNLPRKDSVKKINVNKNGCDSLQTEKTIYYEP